MTADYKIVSENADGEISRSIDVDDSQKHRHHAIHHFFHALKEKQSKLVGLIPKPIRLAAPIIIALFSEFFLATLGPCMKVLSTLNVSPFLKIVWRSQVLLLLNIIPMVIELAKLKREEREKLKKPITWFNTMRGATFWFISLSFYVLAFEKTSVSQAALFGNSTPVVMVILYLVVFRKKMSLMEISGTLISFIGMLTIVLGPVLFLDRGSLVTESTDVTTMLIGDLLAFAAAVFGAFENVYNPVAREGMQTMLFGQVCTFLILTYSTIATLAFESTSLIAIDNTGYFAWFADPFWPVVAFMSVVVGFVGVNVLNWALLYIDPLLMSLIALLNPVIAGVFSYWAGVDQIPTIFTLLGGLVTIGGIAMLTFGEHRRKKVEKKLQDALEQQIPNEHEHNHENEFHFDHNGHKHETDQDEKQSSLALTGNGLVVNVLKSASVPSLSENEPVELDEFPMQQQK